jgi:hypothetical protein
VTESHTILCALRGFVDADAEIVKQANQDNLEGSTLAFTQFTISR